MDTDSLRRLQVIQLDKERGELHEKLRVSGKRIDHFERALRREEIPLLNDDYEAQLAQELQIYDQNRRQKLALAAARHKENINLKKRLQRILPDYQDYRSTIKEKRFEEFETRRNEAQNALGAEKARRLSAYRKYQEEERRKREEEEREEELERERLRKEEEEQIAKEEAARKADEEKARLREEGETVLPHSISQGKLFHITDLYRRKQDEALEKQRQREREAEEKIARKRQEAAALNTATSIGLKPSSNAWRPSARRAEGGTTTYQRDGDSNPRPNARWTDNGTSDRSPPRDQAPPRSDATNRTSSPGGSQTPPPPTRGRYVPPAARRAAQ